MNQSDSFIYLPGWIKVGAVAVLTVTLVGALGVAIQGVAGGRETGWVTVAMSVVQVCVSGLGLALVVFFSQRSISVENLVRKADVFLEEDVPAAVRRLESILPGKVGVLAHVRLKVRHAPGAYGAWYDGVVDDVAVSFRFGLRMRNMLAILYLPKTSVASAAEAERIFAATVKRARDFGFITEFSEEIQERDGREYVLFYVIQDLESGFLFDTESRLALLQQFSLLLRSVCLTARRGGLALVY